MAKRTNTFNMYKWDGGINTSLDEGLISPNQLTRADNIQFTTRTSRQKREGMNHNFDNTLYQKSFTSASISTTADTITITSHGFAASAPIMFTTTSSLPGGISAGTVYYTTAATTNSFQVAATPSGSAIDLTSVGSGTSLVYKVYAFQTSDVASATDIITITAHGLKDHEPVQFTTTGSLPGGISASTTYYLISTSTNTFKLTTSPGSIANVVDITSTGSGVHRLLLNRRYIDGIDYWYYALGSKSQTYIAIGSNGRPYKITTSGAVTDLSGVSQSFPSSAINTSNEQITINNHGFAEDDQVYLYTDGTVPTGLAQQSYYYVHSVSASVITLRTSPSATADIDITNAGSGTSYLYAGWVPPGPDSGMTATMTVVNNHVLMTAGGGTYVPKWWNGTDSTVTSLHIVSGSNFPGTVYPSLCQSYFGRAIFNSRNEKDRLYFSSTGNELEYIGTGDSGTMDIRPGDGDPEGITAIFPEYKGDLYVGKRRRLYRNRGTGPSDFITDLVTDGLGVVSQNTIATIDQDDVFFQSDRGIHSLIATQKYGAFEAYYVSTDIQKSIKDDWSYSRKGHNSAIYLPSINSYLIAVCDSANLDFSSGSISTSNYELPLSTTSAENTLWCYNVIKKAWYRWPGVSASCIFRATDSDQERAYLGTHVGRLTQLLAGNNYDISVIGTQTVVPMTIETGVIYVDDDPTKNHAFKSFSLFYRPTTTHTINVGITIDSMSYNSSTGENYLVFNDTNNSALLGTDFTLGTSNWGITSSLEPTTFSIVGYGKGVKLSLTQSGLDEATEIQGFLIEWEGAGDKQEKSSATS